MVFLTLYAVDGRILKSLFIDFANEYKRIQCDYTMTLRFMYLK